MKLYLNETSPFARLVLMCIVEYQLDKPQLVWVDPWSFSDELAQKNPFSMVPTLELADGEVVYESGIIINYLTQNQQVPQTLVEVQRLALGKMLLETAFRHVSLLRYSPDHALPHPFIARTEKMLIHGLQRLHDMQFELNANSLSMPMLQLFCALDYMDFRLPEIAQQHMPSHIRTQLNLVKTKDSFKQTSPQELQYFQ
ncbi:MAG: glutathione S-transferase N-terminal domain-containing protein [Formosimonas sp.]